MKKFKKTGLILSLVFGGFTLSTLSSCAEVVANTYNVNLTYDSKLGNVTVDHPRGYKGDTFTVTITPNEGIVIKSIKVNGTEREIANSFAITAEAMTYEIAVTFEDPNNPGETPVDTSFSVKAIFDETMGNVTLDKTYGADYTAQSSIVTVTITPNEGYYVKSILINSNSEDTSKTQFYFQPIKGENTVQVDFAKSEGPVVDLDKYSLLLNYDKEKGTVLASETAGQLTEGKTIDITVTPNKGFEVESVTFNGQSLELKADGKYTITPIKGENTFNVIFKEVIEVPPVETFSVQLICDEVGGSASLDKTSGNVGETITLTIEPEPGYQVVATFNDSVIDFADGGFTVTLTPVKGENKVVVKFINPEVNMLEDLKKGFDINTNYKTVIGKADFTKDYFMESIKKVATLLGFTQLSEFTSTFFNDFYNLIISRSVLTQETLDKVVAFISDDSRVEYVKSIITGGFKLAEENLKNGLDLVLPLLDELTQDEFTVVFYCFLSYQFIQPLQGNDLISASYHSFQGLPYNKLESAAEYFKSINDPAANDLSSYADSIKIDHVKEYIDSTIREIEPYAVMSASFIYNFLKKVANIESNNSILAKHIVTIYNVFDTSKGKDFIANLSDSEKEVDYYETFKFLGKVLYSCMPSLDSFNSVIKMLSEKEDMLRDFFKMSILSNYSMTINMYTFNVKAVMESLSEKGEGLYYILKLLGKSLQNATLDEYKSFVSFLKTINTGGTSETDVYTSSIRLSKMLVRNLVEFGSAAETIKNKFADGFEAFGQLLGVINGGMSIAYKNYQGDEETYYLYVRGSLNYFDGFEFSKVSDFITTASQYDPDTFSEDDITYINNFFNEVMQSTGNYQSNENIDTYEFTYNKYPKVGEDLIYDVVYPETYVASKIDFSNIEGFDNTKPNRGVGFVEFDGGEIGFSYETENYSSYVGYGFDFIDETGEYKNGDTLYIEKGHELNDSEVINIYDDEVIQYKLSDLNLKLDEKGEKFAYFTFENKRYFFSYYVYSRDDFKYKYEVDLKTLPQGVKYRLDYLRQIRYIDLGSDSSNEEENMLILERNDIFLENPIEVDTSKLGENTVTFKIPQIEDEITIEYFVTEVINETNWIRPGSYGEFFFYQDESSTRDTYFFEFGTDYEYYDENGFKMTMMGERFQLELSREDFANKLDNSQFGNHEDYYVYNGKKYTLNYYTNKLLSKDSEYHYYLTSSYIKDYGFSDEGNYARYFQLGFYEDEYGNKISHYNYGDQKAIEDIDFNLLNISTDGWTPGEFMDVEYSYGGQTVNLKVYLSEAINVETNCYMTPNEFVLNGNIDDDTRFDFNVSHYIEFYSFEKGDYYYTSINKNLEPLSYVNIKDKLDLTTPGEKTFEYVDEDGKSYNFAYKVIEVEKVNLNETYYMTSMDEYKDVQFTNDTKDSAFYIIETSENLYIEPFPFVENTYQYLDEKYSPDNNKKYLVISSEVNEVFLRFANYSYGETAYFRIKQVTLNEVEISNYYCYQYIYDEGSNSFLFYGSVDCTYAFDDGDVRYLYLNFTYEISYDEIAKLIEESGSYVVDVPITFGGKTLLVTCDFSDIMSTK